MTQPSKSASTGRRSQIPDVYSFGSCDRPRNNAVNYLWLIYSFFFFIEPYLRHDRHYWAQQLPIFGVFLALYVAFVETTRNTVRLWLIAGLYVLGVLTIPANQGASSFFVYVAALLPFCLESSAIIASVFLVEILGLALESWLFPGNKINYVITVGMTAVVGASNLVVAQNKRANLKLRRAQEENLELAALAERERIARDLHDVLGHTLSVIVLKAELAGRLLGRDDERAAIEIAEVESTARTALAEVREAIGGYRAKGLTAEVEQARRVLALAGVQLTCETPPPSLRANEETVLALAVREAVTNIVRHARATQCSMLFRTTPDGFAALEVHDNGQGGASTQRGLTEGNGLRGMRERVQELGGRFRIESALQSADSTGGTTLVIELPLRPLSALEPAGQTA